MPWKIICTILLCVMCLWGCSTKTLYLDVYPKQQLNLDKQQRALPVVLRIYQLTNPIRFEQATFRELWKDDANILQNTLLDRQVLNVYPGKSQQFNLPLMADTKYIGVFALFLNPQDDTWRLVKSVKQWSHLTSMHLSLFITKQSLRFGGIR